MLCSSPSLSRSSMVARVLLWPLGKYMAHIAFWLYVVCHTALVALRSSSCIRLPMFLAHSGRRLRGNARRGHKIIASAEECAYVVGSVARERQRALLMLSALPCYRSHNSVPVMSSAYSRGEWQDIKRGTGGSDQILFIAPGNHRVEGPRRIALGLDIGGRSAECDARSGRWRPARFQGPVSWPPYFSSFASRPL